VTLRRIGPGLVLGAVVVGIAFGERAGPSPAGLALACALVAFAISLATRGALGFVFLCVAALCAGSACTSRALNGLTHSPLTAAIEHREGGVIHATLVDDPVASRFSTRVLARVHWLRPEHGDGPARRSGGGRTVAIDATGDAAGRIGVLQAGDDVRLVGYFRPLDPFEERLRWRHAVGAFAAHDLDGARGARSPVVRVANAARARVLAGHQAVPEPQRALIAGFLVGDSGDLPEPVVADFRASGLSHLVAVSGENVAFVLVLVGPLLRRLPRYGRFAAGLGVLVVFGTMTRWEPSVLRACAMAACSLLALGLGRPTVGLRALALAATVLLLADPFLLHSVGFQLSCAASVGIAVLGPPLARSLPGPRWLRESLGVTVGAQLAVAPILVTVFDGVPLIAIPANLLAAPLVGPLTISGLVGGVVGGVLGPQSVAGATATVVPALLATGVLWIARICATMPVLLDGWALVLVGVAITAATTATVAIGRTCASDRTGRATWRRALPRDGGSRSGQPRMAVPPR
jgi:competence protein ComEC